MALAEFREQVMKATFQPFVIKMNGGQVYPVVDRAHIWLPGGYGSTACVAVPGEGITLIDINSIASVQFEHEIAAEPR